MSDEDPVRLVIDNAQPVDRPLPKPEQPDDDGGDRKPRHRGGGGLPDGCPVVPLGINGASCYYLDASMQLRELPAKDHSRLNMMSLYGAKVELLYSHWKKVNKDGAPVGWAPEKMAEALMAAAARADVWDVFGRVRGAGGWLDEEGALILHCGDGVCKSNAPADGSDALPVHKPDYAAPGLIGPYVYARSPAQPRPADQSAPAGALGPASALLKLLASWKWQRGETDAMLLLGWIGAAVLGGALVWRPLCWITGDRSTGKSTLHKLLGLLFGDALLAVTNVTPAGIWQKVRHASLPVAIDELEADEDNRRSQQVIQLARTACSGGLTLRGGANHEGSEFVARSCFLFSSILVPPLLGQDRSRIAMLELEKLDSASPPDLDPVKMRALGRQLRRRLIDQWPRFQTTLELYRIMLSSKAGHSGRGADQFGTLLAVADLLLCDHLPDSDSLDSWAEKLQLKDMNEFDDDVGDHARCLEHLRSWTCDAFRQGIKMPLGRYIAEAAGRTVNDKLPDSQLANDVLGTYGLKVIKENDATWLAVAHSHSGLQGVFSGTHWGGKAGASGVWCQALRRVTGAQRRVKGQSGGGLRFNGAYARCLLVPIEVALGEKERSEDE